MPPKVNSNFISKHLFQTRFFVRISLTQARELQVVSAWDNVNKKNLHPLAFAPGPLFCQAFYRQDDAASPSRAFEQAGVFSSNEVAVRLQPDCKIFY